MKNIHFLSAILFWGTHLLAQTNVIHTSGKYILGPCGDTLRLKGIDYAPYNWGFDLNDQRMDQIAQTGANVVRMPWYADNPGASVYADYVALDSVISKAVQHDLIVVLEIHDFTCQNDPSALTNGMAWWQSSSVLQILNKYRHSIIVNLANEALYVNYAGDPVSALSDYSSTYENIISGLRNITGFDYPIMIDAPDCGTNSDAFITSGTATGLINSDPDHNLIFSAHAYWYAYANNDSTQMAMKVGNVLAAEIPFVLGEVANQQDDQTMCQYNLNYQALLNYCEQNDVNWLAWSWDHDGCPERQISSDGSFANLTTYGNDILNNSNYGLLTHSAAKSAYLVNDGCSGNTNSLIESKQLFATVYPNPSVGSFRVSTLLENYRITAFSILGTPAPVQYVADNEFRITGSPGVYFLQISAEGEQTTIRFQLR